MTVETANSGFLAQYDAQLVRLGALAERYFRDDRNRCRIIGNFWPAAAPGIR